MAAYYRRDPVEPRAHAHIGAGKGGSEVKEQPGASLTASAHHDPVTTSLLNHAQGIFCGPNIAIAQQWNLSDDFTQAGNCVPLCLARIVLTCGARVQSNCSYPVILCDAGRISIRQMVLVNSHPHFDGDW